SQMMYACVAGSALTLLTTTALWHCHSHPGYNTASARPARCRMPRSRRCSVGRAMTGIVEESYSVGTCPFDALDEVHYCCPQGGLVSVPDDYDVVLLEPNGLQARCDHLPIPVGIGKRADLHGVGGIGDNEGETRLGVRRSWNHQHSCDREIP